MHYPNANSQRTAERIAMLRCNEKMKWLCQSQGSDTPTVLVTGWSGLVRQLALECIDVSTRPQALTQAEALLTDPAGNWHFGENGGASWRITLPDGAWATMLMTGDLSLAEGRRMLSH